MMNRILIPLVVALLTPTVLAQEEEVDEWAALDAEVRSLAVIEEVDIPGPTLWGYVRTNLFYRDEGRQRAFHLDNIRLNFTGDVGEYSYRLTADALGGTMHLEDAWMRTTIGEEIGVTFGQFKIPFLRSGLLEARDLLFIARTRNGIYYSRRDQGMMVQGDHGRLHWSLAGQNGADGQTERMLTTFHTKVNVVGERELPWEGAYRAGSNTRLTLGAGISNDDAASDGTAYSVEAYLVHKGISVHAEWLDYGNDYSLVTPLEQRGGTSPWSITASYMIVPEKYEFAIRFDDFDDNRTPLNYDRQTLTIGINRYIHGHDLKWQLNYADAAKNGVHSNPLLTDGPHEKILALGLTFSF